MIWNSNVRLELQIHVVGTWCTITNYNQKVKCAQLFHHRQTVSTVQWSSDALATMHFYDLFYFSPDTVWLIFKKYRVETDILFILLSALNGNIRKWSSDHDFLNEWMLCEMLQPFCSHCGHFAVAPCSTKTIVVDTFMFVGIPYWWPFQFKTACRTIFMDNLSCFSTFTWQSVFLDLSHSHITATGNYLRPAPKVYENLWELHLSLF